MNEKNIPFLAVGDEELGEETEFIQCDRCKKQHKIQYGTSKTLLPDGSWSEPKQSKIAGFYKCGDDLYLGTINGRKFK